MSSELELMPALPSSEARIGVAVLDIPFIDNGEPETSATADAFVVVFSSSIYGLSE